MKYKFKEFKNEESKTIEENFELLIEHYNTALKDMRVGQDRNSTFDDQFDSFSKKITIASRAEGKIANALGSIPSEWMVIDAQDAPAGSLVRGSTKWDANNIYLTNASPYSGTFKVRFFGGEFNEQPLVASGSGISALATSVELLGGSSQSTTSSRSTYTISSITNSLSVSGSWALATNAITFPSVGRYYMRIEQDSVTCNEQNTVDFYLRNTTDSTDHYTFLQYQTNDEDSQANHKSPRTNGEFTIATGDLTDSFTLEWTVGAGTVTQNGPGRIFIRKIG